MLLLICFLLLFLHLLRLVIAFEVLLIFQELIPFFIIVIILELLLLIDHHFRPFFFYVVVFLITLFVAFIGHQYLCDVQIVVGLRQRSN